MDAWETLMVSQYYEHLLASYCHRSKAAPRYLDWHTVPSTLAIEQIYFMLRDRSRASYTARSSPAPPYRLSRTHVYQSQVLSSLGAFLAAVLLCRDPTATCLRSSSRQIIFARLTSSTLSLQFDCLQGTIEDFPRRLLKRREIR